MQRSTRAGALASSVLHVAALGALLSYEPARTSLLAAAPIMVDWIAPMAKPQAPAVPPRPRPVASTPALSPVVEHPPLSTPAPSPQPDLIPLPAPVAAVQPPAPEAAAPRAPTAPAGETVTIVPPRFDAAYLENPAPPYPYLSRRMGEQGRVLLRVQVNAAGAAEDVEVRDSSGHLRLDQAARETVRRWKFIPAKRGGAPVPAAVLVPVSFRLEG